MSDRWAAADLLAAPIMAVRDNRRLVAEAAGLAVQAREPASTMACDHGGTVAREPASTRAREHDSPLAREHGSTPPDGWLHRLMACDGWDGRRRPLSPEEQLSAETAAELRRLTLAGELDAAWTCHQLGTSGETAAGRMAMRLARVLGVVPGAPDWWFLWGTGAGLIELKVERPADLLDLRKDGTARAPTRTYMRQIQKDFREWAVSNSVRHACCRSVNEVKSTLREWGRI